MTIASDLDLMSKTIPKGEKIDDALVDYYWQILERTGWNKNRSWVILSLQAEQDMGMNPTMNVYNQIKAWRQKGKI